MRFRNVSVFTAFAFLLFSCSSWAQDEVIREAAIHENVKMTALAPAKDIPEDIATQFRNFLPILEEALKESTTDQSDECSLTVRATVAVKEVGSAKVKRAQARITAFRRNSKQEYFGTFILYSYLTSGPVNKEETKQFLQKQILEPAACQQSK
jgi:hypothetical protein